MQLTKQHDSSEICFRQQRFNHSAHQRRHHNPEIVPDDAAERYILQNGYSPAIERDGFWRGCWGGFAALNEQGRREFLAEKKLRRAMRRLIERGAFGSLIDLRERRKREAFDRRMRWQEKVGARRDWERMR